MLKLAIGRRSVALAVVLREQCRRTDGLIDLRSHAGTRVGHTRGAERTRYADTVSLHSGGETQAPTQGETGSTV